jgi:hypothetical protein
MLKLTYCVAAAILGAIIGATAPASWHGGGSIAAQTDARR